MKKMQYSTLTTTRDSPLPSNDLQSTVYSRIKSPKKLLKRIRECEKQIENLKTLPYYTIFKQKTEQQQDIQAVTQKLEKLKQEYYAISQNIRLSA